jgi:hypothetical protein
MKLIQSLIDNIKTALVAVKAKQERMAVWATVGLMGVFSGQAHAANRITQAICDFKNYFFEGALIGAIGALAVTAALVWWLMDDDSKIKGKILGIITVLFLIAAVPEMMAKFGWASC